MTNCLGDVRRTLKAYAAHAAPAGALNERLMGAVGAAWLETRDVASKDDALPGVGKSNAFVWGVGEKFATLLNDTCVHRVLFRDEPTAAGNRLVADTLMTLQDLATARVPLSADATNVALAACAAIAEHVAGSDFAGPACDRLKASAPPPSEGALEVVRRGGLRLVGRTGYPKEKVRIARFPNPGRLFAHTKLTLFFYKKRTEPPTIPTAGTAKTTTTSTNAAVSTAPRGSNPARDRSGKQGIGIARIAGS